MVRCLSADKPSRDGFTWNEKAAIIKFLTLVVLEYQGWSWALGSFEGLGFKAEKDDLRYFKTTSHAFKTLQKQVTFKFKFKCLFLLSLSSTGSLFKVRFPSTTDFSSFSTHTLHLHPLSTLSQIKSPQKTTHGVKNYSRMHSKGNCKIEKLFNLKRKCWKRGPGRATRSFP